MIVFLRGLNNERNCKTLRIPVIPAVDLNEVFVVLFYILCLIVVTTEVVCQCYPYFIVFLLFGSKNIFKFLKTMFFIVHSE